MMSGFVVTAFPGSSPGLGTSTSFWEFGVSESAHDVSGASQSLIGN